MRYYYQFLFHSQPKSFFLKSILSLILISIFNSSYAQCSNYQVYESIGTAIPTSGGTWAENSIIYNTGSARTGTNKITFDAAGDFIVTPQIANPGVFSFWYARDADATAHSFTIQTSPDNSTWTTRVSTTTPTAAYQLFSIDLGALSLTNVYIKILDTRASGINLRYVDDISWTSTITSNNTFIPATSITPTFNCSQSVTCGTTYIFSDAGSTNDNYSNSKEYTVTFTPSAGNNIQMVFSAFNTENNDGMIIYNGPTTASPIISSGLISGGTNSPAGSYYGTTSPGTITSTDATGTITIRFKSNFSVNNTGWLATVTCVPPPATCVAPTSQAAAYILGTTTSTSISGSFSGTANGYLIIRSLTSTPPSQPVNGTIYSSANIASLGAGFTFVQSGSSTSITESGLAGNTQYYYFIYAYNNLSCSGAPAYNTAGPLIGNGITCPAIPNSVVTANVTSSGFTLNWATPTGGSASSITYTVQITTDSGYTANIPGSPFSIAAPTITKVLTGLTSGTTYYFRILASNGCSSSYVTGSVLVPIINDDCSGAIGLTVNPSLTCTTSTSGTTIAATQSLTGCTGTADDDVWYSFTATSPSHTLTATPGTLSDVVFEVYSGSCASLSSIICVNNTTGSATETTSLTGLTSGNTYFVRVYSFTSVSNQGTFSLCVTTQPACIAPASQASAYTSGAITSSTLAASFSGTANGYLVIRSLTSTPPSQPVVGITYSAANIATLGAAFTFVQSGSTTSIAETGLAGNTQYYYFIYAFNNTSCYGGPVYNTAGPLTGNGITCPAIPNSVVTANVTSSGFTLNWATPTGGSASSITYTVQITTDSGYTANISGSPFSIAAPTVTKVLTGLTAGTTYYYRILASNGCNSSYVTGSVTTTALTSTNDLCPANISLTVNPSLTCTSSTTGTTVGATQTLAGCYGTADDDVWYSFVATSTTHNVTVTPITLSDAVFQVFSGSCAALSTITCVDNNSGASVENASLIGLTIGNTYFVRVYSYANLSFQGTFSICITTPVSPCSAITNIAACGTTINATITAGTGYYANSACGFSTPGNELIYSFTPTTTGSYTISQTNSFDFIDYQYKVASAGCSGTGWTCIDDIDGSGSSLNFTLTAGVQYYFLLDPESTVGGSVSFTLTCPPLPVSDEPCTATPLNITSLCSYTTYTTVGATSSSGVPAPGCAGYSGGDIWFSFVVPANGSVRIDTNDMFINDGGMAWYTGACGSLTLLECDDDDSSNGTMPMIVRTGLTPGSTIYVRFWDFGNFDIGTFGICATSPTVCTAGNGTGTSTFGCPDVLSGGLGLSGADPVAMNCTTIGCVNLEAKYLQLSQTTNYTAQSIPYSPPYQFSCLANPVSVNVDDVWSPIVNLPFSFCFYGTNYNQCLISSNGTLTFDLTNNSPSGYSDWSFSNNLPSTSLFTNTIFGAYHDIDPSKGGNVGWELITLNSGCRALVASWNDIPMFSSSCNSSLYTGMIVLYENTNVIEVYIKEKNVCSSWNDGNAIVGIQNADGTQAVVPPGRNGLDANWAFTNEAWRFVPSGTPITSLKWYEGSGTTGTVLGTTDTLNVCPASTTTYTAEVTYTLCNGYTVKETDETTVTINGSKVWNGSTDNDWNKDNNWTPVGIPTSANCIIIPVTANNPQISNSPNALGYNLSIYNNAQLTMNASQNLIITDKITVQPSAIFTINNNANLVQINDSAVNTGSISYKRIAPNIKGSDYVYWSSPVANQNMGTIYDGTFPYYSGYKYQWNTTMNNTNGAGGNICQGLWETASGIMTKGRGYIIRGSSSFGMPASSIPTTFTGVPFNGIIPYTVLRGNYTGAPYNGANGVQITNLNDNYNLLGNPYPSSINALKFLQTNAYNASTNPTGKIEGNVKLWTHGTDPLQGVTNPFYGSFQYNYDANDYLTINYLGSTTPGSSDLIRSGQAFFVQMIDGGAGSGTVSFNNSMRYDASFAPYSNSGFFKNTNIVNSEFSIERHRLWLDLVDSNSQSSGILVGYAADSTNEYDNLFDAPTAIPSGLKLFSTITNETNVFEIQGRSLPFDINDEIPIGVNVPTQGNYSFAIAALDGLFEDQNIYLKDTMLNITHDLKANPYPFTTSAGVTMDRFKIVYINNALGNPNYSFDNTIKVLVNNEITVSSSNLQIESIVVYNLLGQKINTYKNIYSNYIILHGIHKNNTTLFLKIKLQTGEMVTKKISY
jgi:hypothetical protein